MKKYYFILACMALFIGFTACTKSITNEDDQLMISSSAKKTEKQLPIKGTYTTSARILVGPPIMQQEITGYGESSHLGRSMFIAFPTIYFTTPPPFSNSGTTIFKAANGDEFYTTFTGTVTPNPDGSNTVVMNHIINGGTGRFKQASGNFTGFTIGVPGHSEGTITYEGTISY